jgi:predicted RNase H-like HicB family nuclease
MIYSVMFEKIDDGSLPAGYYYAHIPTLGLTTHGLGISGAQEAAKDLLKLWIAEKKANGETVPESSDVFLSTVEITPDAV